MENKTEKKFNIEYLIAGIVGFVLILCVVVLLVISRPRTQVVSTTNPASHQNPDVTISLMKPILKVGDIIPVDVVLTPNTNQNITGISMRFYYDAGETAFKAVSFEPDKSFIANGWLFPIKMITTDNMDGRVLIDISAINTNPAGFVTESPFTIGKINIKVISTISSLTLNLDSSETKILTKRATELKYNYIP